MSEVENTEMTAENAANEQELEEKTRNHTPENLRYIAVTMTPELVRLIDGRIAEMAEAGNKTTRCGLLKSIVYSAFDLEVTTAAPKRSLAHLTPEEKVEHKKQYTANRNAKIRALLKFNKMGDDRSKMTEEELALIDSR